MFTNLLPSDVVVAVHDPTMEQDVRWDEMRFVERAVPKRRAEFAAGRVCARTALHRLGIEDWPLLVGERREPLWPPGIVGSITHTDGLLAVAVARRPRLAGLGIDAEQRRGLPEGVAGTVCTPEELAWCREQDHAVPWETVLFSAKESIYKAWSSATGAWLGYLDVDVAVEPVADGRGVFRLTDLRSDLAVPSAASFIGAYAVVEGLIFTSAVLVHPNTEDHRDDDFGA